MHGELGSTIPELFDVGWQALEVVRMGTEMSCRNTTLLPSAFGER
jgi:hypothetical protein